MLTERTVVNVWADLLKQLAPRAIKRLALIPTEIHCDGSGLSHTRKKSTLLYFARELHKATNIKM